MIDTKESMTVESNMVALLNKGIAAVKKKKLDAKIHAQWVK